MQIRFCLFLFVAVPVLVTASPQNHNCILGCKCQEEVTHRIKLKILDCDNHLNLTKSVFNEFSKNITVILFKNVVIDRITKDAFNGFNNLEVFIVEDSHIGAVESPAFDLPQLGTISFTRTTFGEVANLSSTYLEELIFDNCQLSQVPSVDQLPTLTFLNLANNQIKDIDEKTFANSINLEEVTLRNNSIIKLPVNLFMNSRDFNTLNVDHNPLESFQLNLTSDLEFLSLKSCKLTVFDRTSTKNLDTLTSLDLSGNQISVLPIDAFEGLQDLNYLDLSNNHLVELDDNIFFENNKLDKIILDNNNFESLPNFQTRAKSFQTYHFSCKNCGLTSVSKVFDNMNGLVSLDLSHNKINNVERVFTKMQGLKELQLSHNNISSIGANLFGKYTDLESLNLSHNPLKPLDPVVFGNVRSLKKLDISNSSLTKLWTNHNAILPSLEQLLISKNNLTVITVEDLKVTPYLKIIDLQDNPLNCTKDLHDLIEYLLNKTIYPIEHINVIKTHEAMMRKIDDFPQVFSWKQLALNCDPNYDNDFDKETTDNSLDEDPYYDDDDDDDFDEDEEDLEEESEDEVEKDDVSDLFVVDASVFSDRSFTLRKASYILSITSVFLFTALIVLAVAVAITLLVLKRNKSFNMQNGNLPRFRIPLWHTAQGQKRHSGSVYKPLSEDFSGPRTPIINRYEFKQTPQVHNSIP